METTQVLADQIHRRSVVVVAHDHRPIGPDLPLMRAGGVTAKVYQVRDRDDPSQTLHYERLEEPIELIRAHPNLCCDLAAYQHFIGQDEPYPYWSALKVLEVLAEGVGADRIHWATDWPYLGVQPYPELIRAVREAPFLKAGEAEKILGLNAVRFLEP